MSIREAIKGAMKVDEYTDENSIVYECENLQVYPDEDYDFTKHKKLVAKAAIALLYGMRVQSFTEGGYSKTFSIDMLKQQVSALAAENGLSNPFIPKVRIINLC